MAQQKYMLDALKKDRKEILKVCVGRYVKTNIGSLQYVKKVTLNTIDGEYTGHKVQVDIKYVPAECIRFPSYGQRYYQIIAIDEYSRKRVL